MKKQINYGELYFNREIDLQTNEKGYAIKIGIAQKERTSEDRLKDHQTGNSRKVYVESYIDDVPDALAMEQHLHALLTARRLHGEWFILSMEERALVEAYGLMLRDEIHNRIEFLQKSQLVSKIESNGQSRIATDREIQLLERLRLLERRVKLSSALLELNKAELLELAGSGTGIEGILSIDSKTDPAVFDTTRFKNDHPEIYNSLIIEKADTWGSSFKLSGLPNLGEIAPEIAKKVKKLIKETHIGRTEIPKIDRTELAIHIHEDYLKHDREIRIAKWEIENLTNQLKINMGEFEEIIGVATWKRAWKSSNPQFSATALKEAHPDIHAKYLIHKPKGWSIRVEEFRPYLVERGEISFESLYDSHSEEEIINYCINVKLNK